MLIKMKRISRDFLNLENQPLANSDLTKKDLSKKNYIKNDGKFITYIRHSKII